jgi:hypothetical protein
MRDNNDEIEVEVEVRMMRMTMASLQIMFFLRPMIRYTKILLPRPRTNPSEEASGRGVS